MVPAFATLSPRGGPRYCGFRVFPASVTVGVSKLPELLEASVGLSFLSLKSDAGAVFLF